MSCALHLFYIVERCAIDFKTTTTEARLFEYRKKNLVVQKVNSSLLIQHLVLPLYLIIRQASTVYPMKIRRRTIQVKKKKWKEKRKETSITAFGLLRYTGSLLTVLNYRHLLTIAINIHLCLLVAICIWYYGLMCRIRTT